MDQTKELIIFRGLPGSGKTALARLLSQRCYAVCYSVDDYFTDGESGEYRFNYLENHLAYKYMYNRVEDAMKNSENLIFLHYTFTPVAELEPYLEIAGRYGYRVHIASVEKYHNRSNVHGVTNEQLSKMAEKYQVKLL